MIFDITKPLTPSTKVYDGDPAFQAESLERNGYALSKITMGTHTGTHIDAPAHYFLGETVAEIPLDRLIGKCMVSSCGIPEYPRVLIRGEISLDCALESASTLELIGTDALSIGDDDVHRALLGAGVIILENLELKDIPDGEYTLIALPLKIYSDGAPARVCLIGDDDE